MGQLRLLGRRRFGPFFVVQALGALNDNIFRNALAALIVFQLGAGVDWSVDGLVNLAAMLFILPFFLFSAIFGQLADRFEKAGMIRLIKLFEILICLFAGIGLYLGNIPLLLAVVFLLGFQSSLFGPIKYSILPQLLRRRELTGGNGLVAAGTFIAILAGTIAGPVVAGVPAAWPYWVLVTTLLVAVVGYLAAWGVPRLEIADAGLKINFNPVTASWANLKYLVGGDRTVFNSVLGVSWFWFFGTIFLVQLPAYTEGVLGGDEYVLSSLLALFIIGISIGALACDRLSSGRIEMGLVPIGAAGLTIFGLDLMFASPETALNGAGLREVLAIPGIWRVIFDLVMIGVAGGFFIVPLYALIQSEAEPARRARVIAGMNILNAFMMVLATGLAIGTLVVLDFSIPQLFALVALLNLLVAAYIFLLVPAFALRFLMWVLGRLLYRVRVTGHDQVPETGPALVVCNHQSYMDPLVVGGSIPRPVRFVMYHRIYRTRGLQWLFRLAGAIPVAPEKEDPQCYEQAFEAVDKALARGELVGLFPEGRLSPDGEIQHFRGGIHRILDRRPVPVVPMVLEGLWGGIFSRSPKRWWRTGRELFSRVQLKILETQAPAEADVDLLELKMRDTYDKLRGRG